MTFSAVAAVTALSPATAHAQFGGGIFGAGGFAGAGGGVAGLGGVGGLVGLGGLAGAAGQAGQAGQAGMAGMAGGAAGGISIDAQGIVTPVYSKIRSQRLAKQRIESLAKKHLPADMNRPSKLRKISLVQLEKACEKHAKAGTHVSLEIQYLAGLQRIDYIFVYPELGDIVIAGPAEGFAPDGTGRFVGVTTGRPPIRVDDLINALRAMQKTGQIGCSIDPVDDKLKAMTDSVRKAGPPANRAVAQRRYAMWAKILGNQKIRVWGVAPETHFGQLMVEADWRMKRMSMGLERPGVRGFRSYLSMVGQRGNSMQRWWFTPLYDAFLTTADGNAIQLAGQRAQVLSQEEFVSAAGKRKDAATTRLSTQRFAKQFTDKFPELADNVPVFAQLQNLFDCAIVAALLKKQRLPEKVGWKMSLFLDEKRAPIIKGYAPKEVASMFAYKNAGRSVIGLVGGGVVIKPMQTVAELDFKTVARGDLVNNRAAILKEKTGPKEHPWWWD